MRMCLVALLSLTACKAKPPWAQLSQGVAGDGTIAGAPAGVPRTATPPKIDGVLDDAAWATAAKLGPFGDPGQGHEQPKSPVQALARMTWDDKNLYLGVVVHDKKPTSPFGHDDVDPHVWGAASGVEMMLQPGDPGDNKDYYELQVDVNGAIFDSHFDDYNQPITGTGPDKKFGHMEFSSHVERAVHVGSGFYSVELAYPWASLAPGRVAIPPHAGDVWRVDLYSFRDGQRYALAWSPLRGQGNFHKSSRFGRIKFE
jgi:hypothetical protein